MVLHALWFVKCIDAEELELPKAEYKLDVDFFADCCAHARSKLNHHLAKLRERVKAINDIIGDLEYNDPTDSEVRKLQKEDIKENIDFDVSYCSSEKNIAFYTVIEPDSLKPDSKKRRRQA